MDIAVNTGLKLDELKATAPRGFDKVLIDLLVAIQHGQRPIVAPAPYVPAPAQSSPAYDDAQLRAQMTQLRMQIEQLTAAYQMLDADYRRMFAALEGHTHQIHEIQQAAA